MPYSSLIPFLSRPTTSKANRKARLRALERYRVLDTEHEAQFDDIVREAARECHAPIALISLVDSHRQWFKANHGIEARETDLGQSICAKAIEHEGIFVVPDTRIDPRTNSNPLVVGDSTSASMPVPRS